VLELQRNLYVLRRWWWLLLAALIVGAVVAYGLTKILVKQEYQATTLVAMAPIASQGANPVYVTMLAASADAQLVPTLSTATGAKALLPPSLRTSIDPNTLSGDTTSISDLTDGQILYVQVKWPDQALVSKLSNAMAASFIAQERRRIESRYAIIHQGVLSKQKYLTNLAKSTQGSGQATSWLQAQYAESAARVQQQDADARIQATSQEASLQVAQQATTSTKVGPKPLVNSVLGAGLAFLLALLFAFATTSSYGEAEGPERLHPVLTKVGD
jgi:capsular polysaccharide biosynthesis protein